MATIHTVDDIETAIEGLTPQERDDLRRWFEQRDQLIDTQLEGDLAAGRIDDRIRRAVADHAARRTRPL
jgi:hypothetical protein